MKRSLLAALALIVPAAMAAAKPVPWLGGVRPGAGTFYGKITSATGRYADQRGGVVIRDADIAAHRTGQLAISSRACRSTAHCLSLRGRPSGSMTLIGHPIPDAGYTFTVHAAGRVTPLGRVRVSGVLQVPGFIACGHQTITLSLTGSHGTVRLTAQTRPRCASPLPAARPG